MSGENLRTTTESYPMYFSTFFNKIYLPKNTAQTVSEAENMKQNNNTSTLDAEVKPEEIQINRYSDNLYNFCSSFPSSKISLEDNYSEAKQLISIMRECYFEMGKWTKADEFFEDLLNKYGSFEVPLEQLAWASNHNLKDNHILEGVLHILSNYDYDNIGQTGIAIGIACMNNQSPVIQDLLLSCFDEWNSTDAIEILDGMNIEQPWLAKYKEDVLSHLEMQPNT